MRVYNFQLPYEIGPQYMRILVELLKSYPGTYERLPRDMRARIEAGETMIRKEDLDRVDGPLLEWILSKAGLGFEEVQ